MPGKKEFSVMDVLNETYANLLERNKSVMKFDYSKEPLKTEIANDSDWHRTRVGYMFYPEMAVVGLNGDRFTIGRGEKGGHYPGDIYVGDIIALKVMGEEEGALRKEIEGKIREASYFSSSLIIGMEDGNLGLSQRSVYGEGLKRLFGREEFGTFIMQASERHSEYIRLATLTPAVKRCTTHKPEFAKFLANALEEILKT